jgi:hypothetical protein
MSDLQKRLYGPVQWGYMCLADGGFIADDTPREAAERVSQLEAEVELLSNREFTDHKGEPCVTSYAALDEILHWRDKAGELEAEVERYRAALEPFKIAADRYALGDFRDSDPASPHGLLTVGDLREARRALSESI